MIKVKIDGTEYNANIGLSANETLDETLDSGVIELHYFSSSDNIVPFTLCEIIDDETNETIQMVVQTDDCKLEKRGDENLYSHQLTLIEPVERLKYMVLCNKTFTSSFNIQEPKKSQVSKSCCEICCNLKQGSIKRMYYMEGNNYIEISKGTAVNTLSFKMEFGAMIDETNDDRYPSDNKINKKVDDVPYYEQCVIYQSLNSHSTDRRWLNKKITQKNIGVGADFLNDYITEVNITDMGVGGTKVLTLDKSQWQNHFGDDNYIDLTPEQIQVVQAYVDTHDNIKLKLSVSGGWVVPLHNKVNDNRSQFGFSNVINNTGDRLITDNQNYQMMSLEQTYSASKLLYYSFYFLYALGSCLLINMTTTLLCSQDSKTYTEDNWDSDYSLYRVLKEIREAYYEENKTYPFEIDNLKEDTYLEQGSPEISFVQSTIYQAVADVFSYINAVPTLTLDSNGKWQLGYDFLEKEGDDISDIESTNTESQLLSSSFVNASVGNIKQSIAKDNQKVVFNGTHILPTCNNIGAIKETEGSWGYDLGQPIYKIISASIPNAHWKGGRPTGQTQFTSTLDTLAYSIRIKYDQSVVPNLPSEIIIMDKNQTINAVNQNIGRGEHGNYTWAYYYGKDSSGYDIYEAYWIPYYINTFNYLEFDGTVRQDSDFNQFVNDGGTGTETKGELLIGDYILNDDIYNILPSAVKSTSSGYFDFSGDTTGGQMYKQVVLHYKRGDHWVYFSFLNNNSYWVINDFKTKFAELIEARENRKDLDWDYDSMIKTPVHFEFIPEINVRYKSYTDQNNFNGEILANSNQLLTNTQRLLNNMFGLALKFGVPNKAVSYEFQKFKDRIRKGDYITDKNNNYWIANIINNTVVRNDGLTESKVQLVRNYNKLSQFIKLNQEKRYFQIDDKLVVESERNYSVFMYCCCDFDTESVKTLKGLEDEKYYFMNYGGFTIADTTKTLMGVGKLNVNGALIDSNVEGRKVFIPFKKFSGGNSVVFSCGYDDPIVAYRLRTTAKDSEGNDTNYIKGIFYSSNGYGAIVNKNIFFYNFANLNGSMPYIQDGWTYSGLKIWGINKNPNETLRCNLQIVYLSIVPNRIIFGRDLIEENPSACDGISTLGDNNGQVMVWVSTTDKIYQRYRTLKASGWVQAFTFLGNYTYADLFSSDENGQYLNISFASQYVKSIAIVNNKSGYLVMGVNVNKTTDHIKIYFKATNFHL